MRAAGKIGRPQHSSIYHIMLADAPLANASHEAKPKVSVRENYPWIWILGGGIGRRP